MQKNNNHPKIYSPKSLRSQAYLKEATPLITLLTLCFLFHAILAWKGSLQEDGAWAFALIEGSNLLGIDDAYRYFLSFYAFSELEIYSWDYTLPVSTFLFGIITLISDDNIFIGRVIILSLSILSYCGLYHCMRLLSVGKWPAFASLTILIFMPVQSAMSISYYGEAILVINIIVTMLLYLKKEWILCAFFASLLPLIRPEGFFILAPISIYFFLQKNYAAFLLSGFAGFIYYLFISLYSENFTLSLLIDWRWELRSIWKAFVMPNTYNNLGMFSTYNLFWILAAHAGFFSSRLRGHWPLWLGSILWSLFYTGLVVTGMSSYESRYFSACYPVFVIGFALFIEYLTKGPSQKTNRWSTFIAVALSLFIFFEHFLQYDPLKSSVGSGRRWPLNQVPVIHPHIINYEPEQIKALQDQALLIKKLINEHEKIDILMVFEWPILYFLGRDFIESGVQLHFSPIPQEITKAATGGSFFTYSQYHRKFRYLNIENIRSSKLDGIAIYSGKLTTSHMNPVYNFGPYQLNVVGYRSFETPNWRYKGKIHIN